MNLIAIVLGIFAILIVVLTAILPVIGVIGLVFGLLSNHTKGRNIAILACVLAALRLVLGGIII